MSLQLEILSDYQLVFLVRSRYLNTEKKQIAQQELDRRKLSPERLEFLENKYNILNRDAGPSLTSKEKLLIILFPFFIEIQAVLSTVHHYKRNTKKWKQHWRYLTIGFALWTVIVLVIAALLRR